MKTVIPKPNTIDKKWLLYDAENVVLGRLAAEIAKRIRGKYNTLFSPHMDTGDYVIVVNADKVAITGNKADQKTYFRHSGYPGGARKVVYKKMMAKNPEFVIKHAVKGMLPKNRLGRKLIKKLHIYAGAEHPHTPQKPIRMEFK